MCLDAGFPSQGVFTDMTRSSVHSHNMLTSVLHVLVT